ncbi:MAG: 3,4-dihydroxy-2-butanone-4-phosphate synthase [Bosea sp.]|uniref:3,4-dihydroxy-2-butanone-4-phosphate synthase n=1 Tax=unclassified Bosea (in: a-proteobacteria) TaxID=2653178 RepID=UPI00095B0F83|nr:MULTISPECIES: 3,4-dihydroxy-2-butanone-4-phosphate synthase [unclassified Bosea (in: a-proteobacteria)]MBN9458920.1 3,4-dihydroxy-2-butanone-4-phosphate synthase [Bosea sp. (in: a-proteobacteria)]OJV04507.1 MAG: 3,4-dihydroxy-2-butanone-4-phosphate synthase [Bosea sp. 67-29]
MKLDAWLRQNKIARSAFAKQVGLSPASVTALCNDPAAWISRESAERIAAVTGGSVTPNDFLGLSGPREAAMFNNVTETIEAFARGEIVIVTDDDDRENEGDLIVAASLCTPEKMAFIIRNTCGIVCAPLTASEARRLRLDPMVSSNDAPLGTAFTITVDVKHGLTTGISAEQRTNTVRALANGNMGATDFVRPGHVFPLIAKDGGVLMRSGHTEAAVDLCKLADLPPVGVICELANDDGTVMKGAQISAFAEKHGLKQITVADLIAYRQLREKLVERVHSFPVKTAYGEMTGHVYVTPFDDTQHFAFVMGKLGDGEKVPARLHRADVVADVLGGAGSIQCALRRFQQDGRGVLIYLRDGTAGVPIKSVEDAGSDALRSQQWREVGLGAQILRDLGVASIVNLASSPRSFVGLSGFGIEIAETQPLE